MQEFGRRTAAVAILGTAVVACSISDDSATDDEYDDPNEGDIDGPEAPTDEPIAPTAEAAEPTVGSAEGSAAADPAAAGLQWEQVSFGFVSAYILARGNEYALVDTGLAGTGPQIGEALGLLGANFDDLDHVILTHLHGDHVGGLPEVLDASPGAVAYAGEADVAGIQSPRAITGVNDGDDVFGLRVIGTPGHTAGHICLLDEDASLLIAGDALIEANGVIEGPAEQFSSDHALALESAKALTALQFEDLALGHGSPIRGGASTKFAAGVG